MNFIAQFFEWFRSPARCPVRDEQKEWIERRFAWLVEEFGIARLAEAPIVLPTTKFFPGRYEATPEEVQALLELVAKLMNVDPQRLRLGFFEDIRPALFGAGAAGLYEENDGHFDIWLEVGTVGDPLQVVATLAHEIGHVVLLGQQRVRPDESDHEPLTDLLTVYLGLGILTSNAVLLEASWQDGQVSGWKMQRQGYLSMNAYGYGLALYALARGENSPSWLRHLRADVRVACRESIRYVLETGDCSCAFLQSKVAPNA